MTEYYTLFRIFIFKSISIYPHFEQKEVKNEINTFQESHMEKINLQISHATQYATSTCNNPLKFLKKKQSTDRNPYITNILHPPRYQ